MAWVNISKPSSSSYTPVNPQGKEQYDQASLTYDDSSVFYDGVNEAAWTDISKPSNGYGDSLWQEMNMAWQDANDVWESANPWIRVNKPT